MIGGYSKMPTGETVLVIRLASLLPDGRLLKYTIPLKWYIGDFTHRHKTDSIVNFSIRINCLIVRRSRACGRAIARYQSSLRTFSTCSASRYVGLDVDNIATVIA